MAVGLQHKYIAMHASLVITILIYIPPHLSLKHLQEVQIFFFLLEQRFGCSIGHCIHFYLYCYIQQAYKNAKFDKFVVLDETLYAVATGYLCAVKRGCNARIRAISADCTTAKIMFFFCILGF